jgi:hypothetical protein
MWGAGKILSPEFLLGMDHPEEKLLMVFLQVSLDFSASSQDIAVLASVAATTTASVPRPSASFTKCVAVYTHAPAHYLHCLMSARQGGTL